MESHYHFAVHAWYSKSDSSVSVHNTCMTNNKPVNVIDCITKNENYYVNQALLMNQHGYPKDAAFCIENFHGITNEIKDSVICYLKEKARDNGTELISQKQKNGNDKYFHYGIV